MARQPAKPPGKCIFCEGGNFSKEHIWPEWANPLIHNTRSVMRREERFHVDPPPSRQVTGGFSMNRPGDVTSKRMRVVCESCNNGWMGNVEERAKPSLSYVITGRRIALSEEDQAAISTWVALKLLVTEHSDQGSVITSQAIQTRFWLHREMPPSMSIYLADCGFDRWVSAFFRTSSTMTDNPLNRPPVKEDGTYAKNVQFTSFGIGRAFFFVFYTSHPTLRPTWEFDPIAIKRLHPFVRAPVYWPPLARITAQQASGIAATWAGLRDNPYVKWID